jgi:hypothetical protein
MLRSPTVYDPAFAVDVKIAMVKMTFEQVHLRRDTENQNQNRREPAAKFFRDWLCANDGSSRSAALSTLKHDQRGTLESTNLADSVIIDSDLGNDVDDLTNVGTAFKVVCNRRQQVSCCSGRVSRVAAMVRPIGDL